MILELAETPNTRAPDAPHTLTVITTQCGLVLSWEQSGTVDYWTVWLDQLDGEEVTLWRTVEPRYEIDDLPPGGHLVGVYSTRGAVDSPGQIEADVTVPSLVPGQPNVPVLTELAPTSDAVALSWIASTESRATVQLLDSDSAVLDQRDCGGAREVLFAGLAPRTRYGVRVNSVASTGLASPWCPILWFDTSRA